MRDTGNQRFTSVAAEASHAEDSNGPSLYTATSASQPGGNIGIQGVRMLLRVKTKPDWNPELFFGHKLEYGIKFEQVGIPPITIASIEDLMREADVHTHDFGGWTYVDAVLPYFTFTSGQFAIDVGDDLREKIPTLKFSLIDPNPDDSVFLRTASVLNPPPE